MATHRIRLKILGSLVLLTMLFGVGMIGFAETFVYQKLHDKLRDKGVALAKHVAIDCIAPVITERYFEITMLFKDLLASEQDIVYAYVVDESGRVVAHTFADGVPRELILAQKANLKQSFSAMDLETDKGLVHAIAVPLLQGQAGVLHLGLSDAAIGKDVNDIIKAIILFTLLVLTAGIVASIVLSRLITEPLSRLSKAAESFGSTETAQPVVVESRDEIGELARVFNSMTEKRKHATEERERLIADLHKALDEIKTLQGIIPICANCKKIRDEEGAWHQLEAYISEHTDSTFTHGICKDCVRKLYPDFADRVIDR